MDPMNHVFKAAITTPLDWLYYDRSDFHTYPEWWAELLEEELDPRLYIVALMFTSH